MTDKRQDKTKAKAPATEVKRHGRFWRYGFVLLLTGLVALAWLSMLTFSPTDPPAPTVSGVKGEIDNAAGRVGAYLAYQMHYWLGGGAYIGLLFVSLAAGMMMLGGRISDLPWRIAGLLLLIATTSTAVYVANPEAGSDVYHGAAGVLGMNVGGLLLSKFSLIGTWVILLIMMSMGLMCAADNIMLQIPRLGKKAWTNRSKLPSPTSVIQKVHPKIAPMGVRGIKPPSRPVVPAKRPITRTLPLLKKSTGDKPAIPKSPAKLPQPTPPARRPDGKEYQLPPPDLLAAPVTGYMESQQSAAQQTQVVLQQTLNDFGVEAEVMGYMTGPVITMYELSLSPGVKVSQIGSLATDIARALAVPGVRIVPPRFGKDTVGIEVPNLDKELVRIRELMLLRPDAEARMHLPLFLGKDAAGEAIIADLAAMPHLLIAGTTGSGKSVSINAIIMSILMLRRPEEVRLILVDPKMVEMAAFESLPHLLCPIVNDMRKAEDILEWAVTKMDERYEILRESGVRNLAGYNRLGADELYRRLNAESDEERARIPLRIPHFVIIIDELADLMMTSSKEVESHIIRIAQKARAVGIHLVLATQRPSVNVVTGLIKSNMPCRISFRVASRMESRIVLDQNGAEVLLGEGDMLFLQPGSSNLIRAQGAYVDDTEIRSVLKHLRSNSEPQFN
ncbi:MAG: DNA translocase FtsK, partial [Planctomycetota bacterium]